MDTYKTFTLIRKTYKGYFGNIQYKGKKVLWGRKKWNCDRPTEKSNATNRKDMQHVQGI